MTRPPPIERYLASIRRARIVYAVVVSALLVAIGAVVAVAYAHGEIAHTTSRTTSHPPAAISMREPAATERPLWHTGDRTAIGTPLFGGTLVTFSAHTVTGRNARTGAATWSYSRSDRTVCTAAQAGGITIAVYELGGNCDEVTALNTGTGVRAWTRTLDEDGQPIFGRPTYQVTASTFVVTTPLVIYAIGVTSGIDAWTYHRYGCTITGAVLGSSGALISQDCTKPQCSGIKFCRSGPQLFLRNDMSKLDSSKPNFDQIVWNDYGNRDRPAVADEIVGALNPSTHELDTFGADKGRPSGSIRLSPMPATATGSVASSYADGDLLWISGTTYSVSFGQTSSDWSLSSLAPPTLVSPQSELSPILSDSRVSVPTSTGVAILDGDTGRVRQSLTLSQVPADPHTAYPVGAGYAVSGSGGTVVYG